MHRALFHLKWISFYSNQQIWDTRCLNENNPKEVGVFNGHLDGITYIDSKNDTRYIISNSKDQTIKLWDMRSFSSATPTTSSSTRRRTRYYNRWDYRWDNVPRECMRKKVTCERDLSLIDYNIFLVPITVYTDQVSLPDDSSIMTYRGHRVKKTLIRAKFSPLETTGQRYIYTGCATGRLIRKWNTPLNELQFTLIKKKLIQYICSFFKFFISSLRCSHR